MSSIPTGLPNPADDPFLIQYPLRVNPAFDILGRLKVFDAQVPFSLMPLIAQPVFGDHVADIPEYPYEISNDTELIPLMHRKLGVNLNQAMKQIYTGEDMSENSLKELWLAITMFRDDKAVIYHDGTIIGWQFPDDRTPNGAYRYIEELDQDWTHAITSAILGYFFTNPSDNLAQIFEKQAMSEIFPDIESICYLWRSSKYQGPGFNYVVYQNSIQTWFGLCDWVNIFRQSETIQHKKLIVSTLLTLEAVMYGSYSIQSVGNNVPLPSQDPYPIYTFVFPGLTRSTIYRSIHYHPTIRSLPCRTIAALLTVALMPS